jgi:hypothetical protein
MAERLTCPGCQHVLRVPAGSRDRWLTCPRCLSPVANPEAVVPGAIQAEAPARPPAAAAHGIQAEPITPSPAPPGQCPHCGHEVQPRWLFCPYCEEPLAGRGRRRAAGMDVDVRRDSHATGGCLVLLAVLGALGIGLLFLSGLQLLGQGQAGLLVALAVGLCVLALISATIVAARGGAGERFAGRVVFGTLALSGGLILLLVAILVFAFVVCLATWSGRFH